MENNSLTHWGVKGQRWGIRRYQNKDGTLTPAGKRRYDKELAKAKEGIRIQKNKARTQEKLDKLAELQKQAKGKTDDVKPEKEIKGKSKIDTTPKKKSISDMTDAELNAAISRARMEDTYRSLRPDDISKGQAFTNTMSAFLTDAVAPALIDAGKKALSAKMDDILKKQYPEKKSQIDKLKDEYNLLKVKKDIDDLKNPKKNDSILEVKSWDDALKKQQWEDNQRENPRAKSWEDKIKQQTWEKTERENAERKAREEQLAKEREESVKNGKEYAKQFIEEMNKRHEPKTSDGKFDSAKIIEEYNRRHGIK